MDRENEHPTAMPGSEKTREEVVLKCVKCGRVLPDGSLDCFECRVKEEAERRTLERIDGITRHSNVPWLIATGLLTLACVAASYATWHYRDQLQIAGARLDWLEKMISEREPRSNETSLIQRITSMSLELKETQRANQTLVAQLKQSLQAYTDLESRAGLARSVPLYKLHPILFEPKRDGAGYLCVGEYGPGGVWSPTVILGDKKVDGMLCHAPSVIGYHLAGQFAKITGLCGLKEAQVMSRLQARGGHARFLIHGDDRLLWTSQTFDWDTRPQAFEVNVAGVRFLKLESDPLGSSAFDWTTWANVVLDRAPSQTVSSIQTSQRAWMPGESER